MSFRMTQGWQVMLADLSLILFLSTAAATRIDEQADGAIQFAPVERHQDIATTTAPSVPIAIYRAGGDMNLRQWLASRETDPREQLTIIARHTPGRLDAAVNAAQALAAQASASRLEPRIVIEPGPQDEALAVFDFSSGG